jgi:hypothetical protein
MWMENKSAAEQIDVITVRAIDFNEGDAIDEAALKALILEAVGLNKSKAN